MKKIILTLAVLSLFSSTGVFANGVMRIVSQELEPTGYKIIKAEVKEGYVLLTAETRNTVPNELIEVTVVVPQIMIENQNNSPQSFSNFIADPRVIMDIFCVVPSFKNDPQVTRYECSKISYRIIKLAH